MPDEKEEIINLKRELESALHILFKSSTEIKALRKSNTEKSLRLNMFDDVMLLVKSQRPELRNSNYEDIAYEADKFIEKINKTITLDGFNTI